MTQHDFALQLARLSAAYRKPLGQATAQVYFEALGDLLPHDLASAIAWAIRSLHFLPTPAQLRDRAVHDRASRLRALPAPEPEPLPEWVTEGADVSHLVADLQATLTDAHHRIVSLRPSQPVSGEPPTNLPTLNPEERMARAQAMLRAFWAHNGNA